MSKFIRMTSLAAAAALAFGATPAFAQAVGPSDRNATATARIIKPLTLSWVQDLDFGTVLLSGAGPWTGAVISIAQDGSRTCSNVNVTCSDLTAAATYNVTGTQGQVVSIIVDPTLNLVNANDGTTILPMTVDAPASLTLTNSGALGDNFSIGGSITVDSTTLDGVYSGTFDVTVDYS